MKVLEYIKCTAAALAITASGATAGEVPEGTISIGTASQGGAWYGIAARMVQDIEAAVPDAVVDVSFVGDELIIQARREAIVRLLTFLRDDVNCQFKQLMDVCGVDYPGDESASRSFITS